MLVSQAHTPLSFPDCDLGEDLCVLHVFPCTAEYSAVLCSYPRLRTLIALGSESRDPNLRNKCCCGVQTHLCVQGGHILGVWALCEL